MSISKATFEARRRQAERRRPGRGQRIAACQYAAQRRLGFRWLRFAPAIEEDFRQGFFAVNAMRVRVAVLFGALGIAGYPLFDHLFGEGLMPAAGAAFLLGMSLPFCLVALGATYARRSSAMLEYVLAVAATLVALGVAGAVLASRRVAPAFPFEPVLIATLYSYFLAGLFYRHAIVCNLVVCSAYVGGRLLQDPAGLSNELYFLALANGMGVIGLYFFEYHQRLSFLLERELARRALLDGLTGALNRVAMRKHMNIVWRQAQRDGRRIALLFCDIDHFKRVNDLHGHLVGDACLRVVAEALAQACRRPLDAIGRFGGDEFVAVWYDVDPSWVDACVHQLARQVTDVPVEGAPGLRLQLSGGAVVALPTEGMRLGECMRWADDRLYQAKREARGTVLVHHVPEERQLELVRG